MSFVKYRLELILGLWICCVLGKDCMFLSNTQLSHSNVQIVLESNVLSTRDKVDTNCGRFNIQFINKNDASKLKYPTPPYLLSYQGSGNTYTRLLIELITGFYTGSSVSQDKHLLMSGFEGEKHCDNQTILIKAHPNYLRHYINDKFMNGSTKRCQRQNFSTKNAIVLIRNPWDAFLSEFQRSKTPNRMINSHVHNVLLSEFDNKEFQLFLKRNVHQYIDTFVMYESFKKMNHDVLLIHFENLKNEIWNILQFLFTEKYLNDNKGTLQQRINCVLLKKHAIFAKNTAYPKTQN